MEKMCKSLKAAEGYEQFSTKQQSRVCFSSYKSGFKGIKTMCTI